MLSFTRTLALLALVYAAGTAAAPRAENAMECGIAADMAVVAHSLAREQVQRKKADTIMARIYDVSQSDRGKELMKEILDTAYGASAAAGGTSGVRSRLVAASAFNRPACTSGSTEGGVAKESCVSPASTDCTAGAPPL